MTGSAMVVKPEFKIRPPPSPLFCEITWSYSSGNPATIAWGQPAGTNASKTRDLKSGMPYRLCEFKIFHSDF